eukprot:8123275-Pyramimonas_sp.AAC.1
MGWGWRSTWGCSGPWEPGREARGPPERAIQATAAVDHLMQSGKLMQSSGINRLLGWLLGCTGLILGELQSSQLKHVQTLERCMGEKTPKRALSNRAHALYTDI